MNSKEIIKQTLLHKEPVKIPIDFGGTFTCWYFTETLQIYDSGSSAIQTLESNNCNQIGKSS